MRPSAGVSKELAVNRMTPMRGGRVITQPSAISDSKSNAPGPIPVCGIHCALLYPFLRYPLIIIIRILIMRIRNTIAIALEYGSSMISRKLKKGGILIPFPLSEKWDSIRFYIYPLAAVPHHIYLQMERPSHSTRLAEILLISVVVSSEAHIPTRCLGMPSLSLFCLDSHLTFPGNLIRIRGIHQLMSDLPIHTYSSSRARGGEVLKRAWYTLPLRCSLRASSYLYIKHALAPHLPPRM